MCIYLLKRQKAYSLKMLNFFKLVRLIIQFAYIKKSEQSILKEKKMLVVGEN